MEYIIQRKVLNLFWINVHSLDGTGMKYYDFFSQAQKVLDQIGARQ